MRTNKGATGFDKKQSINSIAYDDIESTGELSESNTGEVKENVEVSEEVHFDTYMYNKISRELEQAQENEEFIDIFIEDDYDLSGYDKDFMLSSNYNSSARDLELAISLDKIVPLESVSSSREKEDYGDNVPNEESEEDSKEDDIVGNVGNDKSDKLPFYKNRKFMIASSIVGVIVISSGVFMFISSRNRLNSVEAIKDKINNMYTNEKQVDIKDSIDGDDVDRVMSSIERLEGKEDLSSLKKELLNIDIYLADSDKVDELNDKYYDFNNASFDESVNTLKESVVAYTTPGLAVTMNNNIKGIEDDYNYFKTLRDELSSVSDYLSFDEKAYQKKVNNVSHSTNKEELQDLLDELKKAKANEKKVQELKDKATDEALKKAEELQKETQKSLDDAKNELNTYKEEAGNFFSDLVNKIKGEDKQGSDSSDTEEETGNTESSDESQDDTQGQGDAAKSSEGNGFIDWLKTLFN